MPHSGGGGSHSGGSYSSSSSSSEGYSGGNNESYNRSYEPFPGSRTYVVYRRDREPQLIYTDEPDYHEEMSKSKFIASILFHVPFLLFGIVALFIAIGMLFSSVNIGYKKTAIPSTIDQTIQIFDDEQHLTNKEEEALQQSLETFRNETGIIPSVHFTEDSMWDQDYNSMENYAMDKYLREFDDEYHLLVVYSYGDENKNTGVNLPA